MKNQNINKGKKLNKKELRTIMGGRKKCLYNNVCILIDRLCAEPICNPIEEPA
ncbi:bacteriocin [Chryseobacterium sp. 22458]|uniref:bacteriocin n=1 Tax=Chryseobacterium sp. 22458 TaxID=3453921 RepID=UPI003F85D265